MSSSIRLQSSPLANNVSRAFAVLALVCTKLHASQCECQAQTELKDVLLAHAKHHAGNSDLAYRQLSSSN
eukprot:3140582-Amphidinium_carterae.1